MNDRDTRRLVRAQNVLTFFKNNSADFAPTSIVHEHISKIGNSVALVTAARAGQSPNRVTKASLLDALLLDLKRIAATARAIELRSRETGFAVPFNKVPDRIEKDLKAYADSLLALLEDTPAPASGGSSSGSAPAGPKAALRARFIQLEINPDFVTNLRHDRDALDQIDQHNTTEVQEGTEDTATITNQLAAISKEIDILDPILGNKYETNPEKLHAWERASRVERDPKRGKKAGGEGDTPAPPATPN
jgi:hypothetical protein